MAEEKKSQEEQEEPKSKKGLIIIIAVAALVLVGGGTAAGLIFLGGDEPAPVEETEEGAEPVAQSFLVPLDSFVVNLADPKGDRFMKATMRVVVNDATLNQRIRDDDLFRTRVRDKTITILSAKRFQDVNSPVGKESLRRELLREYGQIFPADSVQEVLFVEFIVQ